MLRSLAPVTPAAFESEAPGEKKNCDVSSIKLSVVSLQVRGTLNFGAKTFLTENICMKN